ncbi:MAG: ACP S-malonyltransferase [Alphaproteobacteria bacterium]|nr:ACP S-malonyltransferase [Alphaproteobacteria bacterium]
MSRALVFPGQGSQSVGMGKELAGAFSVAKDVFGEIDEALSQKLSNLMFEGDEKELTLTENAQPALMAVSMAVVRVLEKEGGIDISDKFSFTAGHSLGEYSALCASGAISLTDTAKLLKTRGKAMQKAVPVGQGTMAALLGLDFEAVKGIAEKAAQGQVCCAANDNANGQIVVSGHVEAVNRAITLAKENGAKRAVLLPVSAPFHCSLMQPAADVMKDALADVNISEPKPALVANVTASATSSPDEIRKLLVQQVTGAVRWRESVLFLKKHAVDTLVEAGTGKVLTGLVRRIDKGMKGISLNTCSDIEDFLKQTT